MFSAQVYRWNSVDVANDEDGIYDTRGIVVDKAENGLLVDFGIANKEPQLVAFDRLLHGDKPAVPGDCASGDCVNHEFLFQLSPEKPWTWYSSELFGGSRTSCVIVDTDVTDGHIREIIRRTQFRCCTKSRSAVLFNDYLKERVSVPYDDFVVTPSFRKLWTGNTYLARTYPIGIVDKRFYYIQRRHDEALDPSIVASDIENIMSESTTNNRGLKRSHEDREYENTKTEPAISDIPYDVLHLALSYLDTVQLVRYRQVCTLWDSVIISMESTKVIIYDVSAYENKDTYAFAVGLFKLIKETTIYLIFTRRASKELTKMGSGRWFRKSMRATKTILHQAGIAIPTLVLADLPLDRSVLLEQSHKTKEGSAAMSKSLRGICQRLVLVRVTLLNLVEDDYFEEDGYTPYQNLEIPYAVIRTVDITQHELRDVLEPSAQQLMRSVDKCDMERLSDWIIGKAMNVVVQNGVPNLFYQSKITEVLQTWEGDDRRFVPACTWKDVEAAQLGSKLDTLHGITVMCLLYEMGQCALFGEDNSDDDDEEEDSDDEEESDGEEEYSDELDSVDQGPQ